MTKRNNENPGPNLRTWVQYVYDQDYKGRLMSSQIFTVLSY